MNVGILFRALEKNHPLSDSFNEVLDTVKKVEKVMKIKGYNTIRIEIGETYEELVKTLKSFQGKIDVIINLGEAIGDDTSYESKIIKLLSELGFKFTGSDYDACKLSESKITMKKLFLDSGLPTANYEVYDEVPKKDSNLNFPLIAKPSKEGGSLGITFDNIVENNEELKKIISKLLKEFNQTIIVEEYIEGREIYVPIIGNDSDAKLITMSENIFKYPKGTYNIVTYDAKWTENSMDYKKTRYKIDPPLDQDVKEKIEKISLEAYKLSKCKDYCRVDFRVKDGIPYILELNYNPCINPKDLIFSGCIKKSEIKYEDFIIQIIESALSR